MKNTLLLILGIGIFMFQACKPDFDFETEKISDKVKISSEWAVPIINSEIKLKELMPKTDEGKDIIIKEENGFRTLIVEKKLELIKLSKFMGDLSAFPKEGNVVKAPLLAVVTKDIEPKSFDLDLEDDFKGFRFADPKLTIKIINYWPVPMQLKLQNATYLTQGNETKAITSSSEIGVLKDIKMPELGKSAETVIELNSKNSNLTEVINAIPRNIKMGAYFATPESAKSNMNMPPTSPPTFDKYYHIPTDKNDSIAVRFEVPFNVSFENASVSDTMAFDFASDLKEEDVEHVKLHVIFDNGFPMTTNMRLILTDGMYNHLDELNDDDGLNIKAGNSKDGKNDPVQSTEDVIIKGEKIKHLINAEHLIIESTFNSKDAVKIYDQYSVGIKLSAKVKFKYEN